ncbi:hypothetical protein ACI7BZ_01550 [Xanthobacter sp. AM11]|uniref:hypothetical protein n=1 Tax=Xanthobacter sp. AM11 TaxID=3380643 RepID=UPI0039BF2B95
MRGEAASGLPDDGRPGAGARKRGRFGGPVFLSGRARVGANMLFLAGLWTY